MIIITNAPAGFSAQIFERDGKTRHDGVKIPRYLNVTSGWQETKATSILALNSMCTKEVKRLDRQIQKLQDRLAGLQRDRTLLINNDFLDVVMK
jgi:hypothetical protein